MRWIFRLFDRSRSSELAPIMERVRQAEEAAQIGRAPEVNRLSSFYEMAYGASLSDRGRLEADFFVRTNQLMNDGIGGEFDNKINFERAFSFLVQQRQSRLSRAEDAGMSLAAAGGFGDRVSARVNIYSGRSSFGV
jgi:hypothetical protein